MRNNTFKPVAQFTYGGEKLENIEIKNDGQDMLFILGGYACWAKRNDETGLFDVFINGYCYGYFDGTETICRQAHLDLN